MHTSLPTWSPVPSTALDRLQYVHNSAARVFTRSRPWQHTIPTLIHLRWLPVKSCITSTNPRPHLQVPPCPCPSVPDRLPPQIHPILDFVGFGHWLPPHSPLSPLKPLLTEPFVLQPLTLWNSVDIFNKPSSNPAVRRGLWTIITFITFSAFV